MGIRTPARYAGRMPQPRQMTLIAFMQAQNCSNYVGSWRHPASMSDFMSPEYYQRIARTLEDAKFDLAFFDDRLAMPDIYGNDHRETVANGIRCVKLDPTIVLMAMAAVTTRLGLGSTYSTTYYEPFHVARLFATLDLMTGGRVAWNVVTSLNNSEAENFGHEEHLEHDLRYDRADEFMEVVTGLWDSWEDDALIVDKQTRPLRRSRQGPPPRPSRQILQVQGPAHRAALGAGPSGPAAGGPERPRHGLRGRAGRSWSSPPIRRSRSAARTTPTSRARSRRPAAIRRCSRSRRR